MTQRSRIFLGLLLIYAVGMAFLLYRVRDDIDPRYREAAEESMVDTAQLMASLIEQNVIAGAINTTSLEPLFRSLQARQLSAQIYNLHKTRVELRAYVTDRSGRLLFDSTAANVGADFSQRLDVGRTLQGFYGARTTRDVANDPLTSVMYVAAPIRWNDQIVGVVSVGKPVHSFGQFIDDARTRTLWLGIGSALAVLLLAIMVSVWLVRPFGLVSDYWSWARNQRRLRLGAMARRGVYTLRRGIGELRETLAGRNLVSDYVQTFTHEVKGPLSAIRGAAELLEEASMPQHDRVRFLGNITRETQRIQEIVDRMMELTALETRRVLERTERVALAPLLADVAASAEPAAARREVQVVVDIDAQATVEGDPFLLRRAVSNLLDNAIDFAPRTSEVLLGLDVDARQARIIVRDHGQGIPAYAQGKVFQKFYSLARPHSRKRSTGLGLAFVKEIAALHGGRIELENAPGGGALATLTLPVLARSS
ncbi:MAG: two-component system sensor histidine kinase CreC [Variovorax sp.]